MSEDKKIYDIIIVGAGISGAVIAKEIRNQFDELQCENENLKMSVLMLEAGTGKSSDFGAYDFYNDYFYNALIKVPNSPYPDVSFAPSPSVLDPKPIKNNVPDTSGYFVQNGPFPFLSNYNKNVGGTTLHWLGTTPRMLPNDFKMKSEYGKGRDWPISYEDLQAYYQRAEKEIGVSAEVDDQSYLGIHFEDGYVYPMHRMPQSYLDQHMGEKLDGEKVLFGGDDQELSVVSSPQGRNGMPNVAYNNGEGYQPVGAVGNPDLGQRCEGNANCVPICPVQAKYNANKSLHAALDGSDLITLVNQSPVSKLIFSKSDPSKVVGVEYKTYEISEDGTRVNIESHTAMAKTVVLAANAIENAKMLLASDACTQSGQVGRNLMDHLVMLTWGFFPKDVGAYRGPGSTSGIPIARDGSFRSDHSAFWIEIGNWGWNWPANAPETFLTNTVDGLSNSKCNPQPGEKKYFGKELREYIRDKTSKQFRMGWEIEQLPSDNNFISIDENYKDALGNYRPVINYQLNDYERSGGLAASRLSEEIFQKMGVESMSEYCSAWEPGYFEYKYEEGGEEKTFAASFNGAGHVVGTHRMGDDPKDSVVDSNQRAHDHPNLFVTGAGSFVTLGTSNPTLTLTALAYRTADQLIEDFKKQNQKTIKK